MNKKLNISYQILMAILAIFSIVLIVADYANQINITQSPYNVIDNSILIIFAIDYFTRLVIAKDKKEFFKDNIFDLLSIIPANNLFYFFRITRLGRLLRLLKLLRVLRLVGLVGRLEQFLKINGFIYYLYVSIAIILVTSSMFCISEKVSFSTALWWSITTSTTVGYGDVSPATAIGKIAAVIDMLVGIGLIGVLTSSITNIFSKNNSNNRESEIEELKKQNQELMKKLNEIEKFIKNNH